MLNSVVDRRNERLRLDSKLPHQEVSMNRPTSVLEDFHIKKDNNSDFEMMGRSVDESHDNDEHYVAPLCHNIDEAMASLDSFIIHPFFRL